MLWFPLLEPYELNSNRGTSLEINSCPDGADWGIETAGDIWSVVTELPKITRHLESLILIFSGSFWSKFSKYGGFWI